MGVPDWVFRLLISLGLLGFPLVAYLAWVFDFDLTRGITRAKHANRPRRTAEAIVVSVYIIAASGLMWYVWNPAEGSKEWRRNLIDESVPSLAVLPFRTIGTMPGQDFFVDGMTDDLITDLSQISQRFVVARNSVFALTDKKLSQSEIAAQLGVRFLLECSVRMVGDNLRINAQLIDSQSGATVWADRYEAPQERSMHLQERVTTDLVDALEIRLTDKERSVLSERGTTDPAALAAYQRGWALYRSNTPRAFAQALGYFTTAIELDDGFHQAYAGRAAVYQAALVRDFTVRIGEWTRSLSMKPDDVMRSLIQDMAKASERPSPLSRQVESRLSLWRNDFERAVGQAENAIQAAPNDPLGYVASSAALTLSGLPTKGMQAIKLAEKLDPETLNQYLFWEGLAAFVARDYATSLDQLTLAQQLNNADDRILIVLAATQGHLGMVEAKQTINRLNALQTARTDARANEAPGDILVGIDVQLEGRYTLTEVDLWPFKNVADREHLRKGLAKAGLPESGSEDNAIPQSIEGAQTVSVAQAKALFDEGISFVDVRGLSDRNIGFIPGSIFLNLQTDLSRSALLARVSPDAPVLFHCEGMR